VSGQVVADLFGVVLAGGFLEPVWGMQEFAKFMLLVTVASCVGAAGV
jgi:hypothetical protein